MAKQEDKGPKTTTPVRPADKDSSQRGSEGRPGQQKTTDWVKPEKKKG